MSLIKIKKLLGDHILEQGRFGRTEVQAIWIESKALKQVAEKLNSDPELLLNWLENLSVMEMDGNIILNYFLRSHATSASLILRVSLAPATSQSKVIVSTVTDVWAMAELFEAEIEDLFGVPFKDTPVVRSISTEFKFAPGSEGFPLRKSFRFSKGERNEVTS